MPLGRKKKNEPDITNDFGGMESEEDESGSDAQSSDDDAPIYKVADEDGQVALDPPVRYQARSNAKIRIMSAVDSNEVGIIEPNQWITVTHTKDVNGQCRLRFVRGWTSYKSKSGYNLMLKEGEENPHYKLLPDKEIDIRKEADPASEVVGKLSQLCIIEALEVLTPEDKAEGGFAYIDQRYVKISAGWVSTHAITDKLVGGSKKGIVETACLATERVYDPEGDARREKEAIAAAKQAKLDAKKAKKDGKRNKKQGLAATKAELAEVQAFSANVEKTLATLPESLAERKADLELCCKSASDQIERLQKDVHDLDGTNLKQQKAEVVALGKWDKDLAALLGSIPECMKAPCTPDIE